MEALTELYFRACSIRRLRLTASAALTATVVVILFCGAAFAVDFSADMVSTTKKQGVFRGKIAVAGEKARMEAEGAISITRMDKKVVWVLMPAEKMYMEQPLRPENVVPSGEDKMQGEVERKSLGTETVEGEAARKYRVTYKAGGKKEEVFLWAAVRHGLPLKIAAIDGSWVVEYKNIKTGQQPDKLFEIPAGYKKFSFSMPSMPGMGGRGEGGRDEE
ncbi:MAG: DUF4412 domain-containing protein [Deltaproteobacteria bacterium]|nr:DUF4412 domain-containing protein [Deltaproteobacteria bacterium]